MSLLPFPLSIPYPTTLHPRPYGPITANTNFCELDHQFSRHIAELINTLSNLTYLVYAYHGLRQLYLRSSHHSRGGGNGRSVLTFQSALPHLGIALVGVSSAAYHATLLKTPQLADELSMALPTGAVFARLVATHFATPRARSRAYWVSIAAVAAVYAAHVALFANWVHYPAFGGMVLYVGRRCIFLVNRDVADPRVRRAVRRQTAAGEVLFVGAFALWLVDRLCCAWLRGVRDRVGLPWGWALELHGWWHVGTAMGAYVFVQVAEYVVAGEKADPGRRLDPFYVRVWGGSEDNLVAAKKGE